MQKCRTNDLRNILERASARETAARVAAGGVAKALLRRFGIEIRSHVVRIGDVAVADRDNLTLDDFEDRREPGPMPGRRGRGRDEGGDQGGPASITTPWVASSKSGRSV